MKRAPPGADIVAPKLEEFEQQMRDALDAPLEDKRNNELTWPTHKLHYKRNRYVYEMQRDGKISKKLVDYLVKEKVCDGPLVAKWKKPGYERCCSLLSITKSNTNFGTVSACRTPLRNRTGQIMPDVKTGCVSCASGDGGPIWWDDPVPEIAKRKIRSIDPGKAALVDGEDKQSAKKKQGDDDGEPASKRARTEPEEPEPAVLQPRSEEDNVEPQQEDGDADDEDEEEDPEVMERIRRLKKSMRK